MTENVDRQLQPETAGEDLARAAEVALEPQPTGDPDPSAESLPNTPDLQELTQDPANTAMAGTNLGVVMDIPVQLSLELGRTRITIRDLLQLGEGSVVKLDRPPGEALDIFVNDCLVARGEVVVINDRFGMRITDIVSPEERLKRLR